MTVAEGCRHGALLLVCFLQVALGRAVAFGEVMRPEPDTACCCLLLAFVCPTLVAQTVDGIFCRHVANVADLRKATVGSFNVPKLLPELIGIHGALPHGFLNSWFG